MNNVEKFIADFKAEYPKELEDVFKTGYCYYFAIMLKERFKGTLYYLPIEGHFVCCIKKEFFDITGKLDPSEWPYEWEQYQIDNKGDCGSIIKGCITK